MKAFSEQLNVLKFYDDGITTMENFSGTTIDITLNNHHKWGCPVYIVDARFQGNIARLNKWEPN